MRSLLIPAVSALALLAACGDSPIGTTGEYCASSAACSGLSGIYCAEANVCTRTCTLHSDCGCPSGTSNSDLVQGACEAACITFGDSDSGYCLKICDSNTDCAGETTCRAPNSGSGYSVCGPK